MNIRYLFTSLFLLLTLSVSSHAAEVAGVSIPDTTKAGDTSLVLNGAGVRSKLFIKGYVGSLYLPQKSTDASAIINADTPLVIRLDITSGMVTADKMRKAILEGFENATDGNTAPVQQGIDSFLNVFRNKVSKGDTFEFIYLPGTGTRILKNGTEQVTIPGLDFKKALVGIWLSDKPAQESLKKAMLGR